MSWGRSLVGLGVVCGTVACGSSPDGSPGSGEPAQDSGGAEADGASGASSHEAGLAMADASRGDASFGAGDASGADGAAEASASSGPPSIPLTGCASAGYAADFTIGGQHFQLIVDTGSGDLAVASSSCTTCGVSPAYTPGPTATDVGQMLNAKYALGSWAGELYTDEVSLEAVDASTTMTFAAIRTQTQFFQNAGCGLGSVPFSPQGIAGFGPAGLSHAPDEVYFPYLVAQGRFPQVFAVELCSLAGQMWIGGFDASAASLTGPVEYTPMTKTGYYSVTFSDMLLGGTSLGFGSADFGRTVVDTGTSSLALPTAIFDAATTAIGANATFAASFPGSASGWIKTNSCYASSLSRSALDAQLPGMTIVMPGTAQGSTVTVALTATQSYLIPIDVSGTPYYCSGLLSTPTSKASSTATTLFGASWMSTRLVVFDAVNARVGFAPQTHCR